MGNFNGLLGIVNNLFHLFHRQRFDDLLFMILSIFYVRPAM